jgi:D-hexose-6-phosphate mutarotase
VEFQVENVGENPTPFQFVLHSYWGTPNPATAIVRGLGERYLDNLRGFQEDFDPAPESPHLPPYDRVYPDAAAELEIRADRFLVHAETVGCAGAVLWSPGEGHTIPDLGSPEFLCVESGVIRPARVLAPGEAHSVRIRYRVERL